MKKITILGCGRWASFHAWYQATKLGNDVLMWGREGDPIYDKLAKKRKNEFMKLPKNVNLTSSLSDALAFSDIIFIIISAQGMREVSGLVAATLKDINQDNKIIVHCIKGIDEKTSRTVSQMLRTELDANGLTKTTINTWVGPGHVQENCLNGQPAIMIVAGENPEVAKEIAKKFSSSMMKLYASDDLIGAEVGATTKNVLGIAAGMLEGLGYGSLKGALMARGCYEVSKLIEAMGGNKMTAYGLAHLGDFEATLFSRSSNNRKFGEVFSRHLVKEKISTITPSEVVRIYELSLAEGVTSSKSIYNLAKTHNISMPICETVYKILHEGVEPQQAILDYFKREYRYEFY